MQNCQNAIFNLGPCEQLHFILSSVGHVTQPYSRALRWAKKRTILISLFPHANFTRHIKTGTLPPQQLQFCVILYPCCGYLRYTGFGDHTELFPRRDRVTVEGVKFVAVCNSTLTVLWIIYFCVPFLSSKLRLVKIPDLNITSLWIEESLSAVYLPTSEFMLKFHFRRIVFLKLDATTTTYAILKVSYEDLS
jgi:hypothetical protein